MDKSKLSSFLTKYTGALGPAVYSREIDFGDLGGKQTFTFRRLSYLETQLLRDAGRVAAEALGAADFPEAKEALRESMLLAPVRQIAATLIDDKGEPLATYDEIIAWDPNLIDKLFLASVTVNAQSEAARAEIGKKSEATPVAAQSSS